MTKRTLLLTGASCVLLLGGGGAAVTAIAQEDAGRAEGATQAPIASLTDSPAASLDVFTDARTGADALPPALAETTAASKTGGVNVELSRRAFEHGDTTGYIIPSAQGACLVILRPENAAGGCTKAGGDPGVTFRADGSTVFYGVVPNGVEEVTTHFADGASSKSITQGNTLYVEVPKGLSPTSISYTAPGADETTLRLFVPDVAAIERAERARDQK